MSPSLGSRELLQPRTSPDPARPGALEKAPQRCVPYCWGRCQQEPVASVRRPGRHLQVGSLRAPHEVSESPAAAPTLVAPTPRGRSVRPPQAGSSPPPEPPALPARPAMPPGRVPTVRSQPSAAPRGDKARRGHRSNAHRRSVAWLLPGSAAGSHRRSKSQGTRSAPRGGHGGKWRCPTPAAPALPALAGAATAGEAGIAVGAAATVPVVATAVGAATVQAPPPVAAARSLAVAVARSSAAARPTGGPGCASAGRALTTGCHHPTARKTPPRT
mmetsp:Transcript_17540/g.37248  ORF Transcript_17540/g.37248 Transcript_17540/m.37248 type:complete len:273 (-) Transcript_17540:787-1605(-)